MNSGTIVVYSFLGALSLGTAAYIYFSKDKNSIAGAEKAQNNLFKEIQGSSTASVDEAVNEISNVYSSLNGSSDPGSSGGSKRKKQSKNKRKKQSKNKRKKLSKKGGK
jgi:hypothetical protein